MATITDRDMRARPKADDVWIVEKAARGEGRFEGRITPSGTRAFYFRYAASDGRRVRLPIGPYDAKGDGTAAFTVQQARDRARELSVLYRNGVHDLREHFELLAEDARKAQEAARLAAEAEIRQREEAAADAARRRSVRQVFEQWRTADLQPRLRADGKRTGRKDGGQYVADQFARHVFPSLGDKPIADVRKADLLALLDAQKSAGKARTANVLLTDLKQMLDFAAEREMIGANPIARVKRSKIGGASVERNRHLADEIDLLAAALAQARMHPRSVLAVWLTLATAVRIGECMGAAWGDTLPAERKARQRRINELREVADAAGAKLGIVDTKARTWHLPDTKNQRSHTIHLSAFALVQIERLAALRELAHAEPSPWLFPATDAKLPVCIKSLGKQIADRQREPERRMRARTKATEALLLPAGRWTMHDLRRTAATLMARLGIGSDVIDECLNHMPAGRMVRVYVHDRREADQARAFDALGQRLAELTSGKAQTNVVPIRAA